MSSTERLPVRDHEVSEKGTMGSVVSPTETGDSTLDGELYFEPKRVYRMGAESSSRSSLVRVYSENERANFDQVTGSRIYDDLKHRPIPGSGTEDRDELQRSRKRRLSLNQDLGFDDMQDEYIPDLDFAEAVMRWQSDDGSPPAALSQKLTNSSLNATPTRFIGDITRTNTWSTGREPTSSSVSPNSSYVFDSSHAQVEPIPLPNASNSVSMMTPLSATGVGKSMRNSTTNASDADGYRHGPSGTFFQPRKISRRKTSVCESFNSASSSLTYLPDSTVSIIAELKMTPEEVLELMGKLPPDFVFMPYSQRKKVILDMLPDKDYKLLMSLIKKFMLRTTKSSTSISKNSLPAAAATVKSRHGSVASQFLSSFSPAGLTTAPSVSSGRPDDKGMEIMGYSLGRVIGFGAWGMIRECQNVETGVVKAMKIVRFRSNFKVKNQVMKEVSVWKELHHPNILRLIQWRLHDDYAMYCLTERIHDGTLYDLVISWGEYDTSKIDLVDRCRLTIMLSLQITAALRYMHEKFVAHGDVKLENCLLEKQSNGKKWKVFLCDFGMSCHYRHFDRVAVDDESNADPSPVNFEGGNFSKMVAHFEKKDVSEKSAENVPIHRSRSSSGLRYGHRMTKLHRIIKNKKLTHDDTPLGISSLPKTFGPSLTSARMGNASFPSLRQIASQSTTLTPTLDMTSPHRVVDEEARNIGPDPHSHIGSLPYAAPELLEPSPPPLGPSADIWALGVTLYTMLTGKLPFKHEYEPRMRAMIMSGKFDRRALKIVCHVETEVLDTAEQQSQDRPHFTGLFNAIVGCLSSDLNERWELNKIETSLKEDLMKLPSVV